jgi:ribosomal protein S18 acetylase RimI-like enzyme
LIATRKDWDSEFFGYEVYELRGETFTETAIKEQLEQLKNKKARLVYLFSKTECKSANQLGGRLFDKKILYEKHLDKNVSAAEKVEPFSANEDYKKLEGLSLASGAYSRFRLDPSFKNNEFEKMYSLWIKRSVERMMADDVLVYKEDGKYLGMVTVSVKEGGAWIGLIAVEDGYRGKNIGSSLMHAAENFGIENKCQKLDVYTQKDNEQACRFYEKNGYKNVSLDYIYHFWLND